MTIPPEFACSVKMLDIPRLFRWIFRDRNQAMSLEDLETMDVSVEYPLTMFDQEKFVVENGQLVATTATINEDKITDTDGPALEGYRPLSKTLNLSVGRDFDANKHNILRASKATSLLLVQLTNSKGESDWEYATAFFVAPNLLLTAGHAALDPPDVKTERWVFLPGTPYLDMDQIASRDPWAIRCTVVDNMYKAGAAISKDIAILSSGSFETKHYLKLSTDLVPAKATIDVVGYPSSKKENWLRRKHPDLESLVTGATAVENLLPTRKLVVTRGVVADHRADVTSYIISTCPGLSGGCLIYNGKVHGKPTVLLELNEGVHVGDSVLNANVPKEWRSAVSFQSEATKKLLRKHKLM